MNPPAPSDEALEKQSKALFGKVEEIQWSPSPFLRESVVSALEKKTPSRKLPFLSFQSRSFQLFTAGVALAGVLLVFLFPGSNFRAPSRQPIVIRMDTPPAHRSRTNLARVKLPAGIQFYSENHPHLKDQREIILSIDQVNSFPFVIAADEKGERTIHVEFLNELHSPIAEREISIRFL